MKYLHIVLIVMLLLASGCTEDGGDSDVCEISAPSENASVFLPRFSQNEIGNETIFYIVQNFLTPQGLEGELVGNEKYGEDLYRLTIRIGRGGEFENTTLYVTKDGKLILPGQGGGIVDVLEAPPATAPPETAPPARPVPTADDDPFLGPEDATVVIIEFSDFQCPYCKRFHDQTMPLILENYGDRVKFVYRDYPLSFHEHAQKASEASECADEQGKYWEYHHILYERQNALDTGSLKSYAAELELDTEQFDECLDSGRYAEEVAKDLADGANSGVTGTPAFFVNDQFISGAQSFEVFQQAIEAELAELD